MTELSQYLDSLVADVPDFPEPGIVFKDITPLLADHTAFVAAVEALAEVGRHSGGVSDVDKVLGMEARGFILAAPVALVEGVEVHLEGLAAVLEVVAHRTRLPRQLAGLADRHEADAQ